MDSTAQKEAPAVTHPAAESNHAVRRELGHWHPELVSWKSQQASKGH